MSEMAERVAAALKTAGLNEDWDVRVAYANAAIEAMREPTDKMLDASWQATIKRQPEEYMAMALLPQNEQHPVKMRHRYRAMIDAALTDKQP
jgi:isochorismate hydrolase